MTDRAVVLDDVTVDFGSIRALDGINLDGRPRAHRSASSATTAPARPPRSGSPRRCSARTLAGSRILGFDALADPQQVRRRIGVTGQYAGPRRLPHRPGEHRAGRPVARARPTGARERAGELLDRFDLGDLADRRVGSLSGGSRRRIDLAASLVGSPAVLFLDEPTTGLDPVARAGFWAEIVAVAAAGATVVLTTQYLDEADQLADRIAVVDHGRIVATGTPAELKATRRRQGGPCRRPPSTVGIVHASAPRRRTGSRDCTARGDADVPRRRQHPRTAARSRRPRGRLPEPRRRVPPPRPRRSPSMTAITTATDRSCPATANSPPSSPAAFGAAAGCRSCS